MTGFAAQLLILSWAALSIFSVGIALCRRFTRLRGLELIAYGAAAGVFVHAGSGVLIALDWHLRRVTAIGLLVCAALAIAYLARLKIWRELGAELNGQARVSLAIWCAFVLACLAIVHLDVRWPARLPDGRYIFKTHTSNVKVQYMTGLPSDNYIPYIVAEFFARRISFKEVRPILPGNEISNRTILMSLVDLPFRTLLARHERLSGDIGKFDYIGARWPDVAKLNADGSFDQFFPVGLLLNALLFLALLAFISGLYDAAALATGSLLYATSPYLIGQTIFTWPKALAGFFVVLCWNSMRRGHDPKVVALLAALAFHSHPASVVAAACLGVWYLIDARRTRSGYRAVAEYAACFFLCLLPWFIWTRLVLQVPSDLVTQNFAGVVASHAMGSMTNFVWVRFVNLFNAIAPPSFAFYPFPPEAFVDFEFIALPMVVGLILIGPALLECRTLWSRERSLVTFGFALPALIILLVFSYVATPALHGWQPMIGAFIFLAAMRICRRCSQTGALLLVGLQLLCNFCLLALRGAVTGVHL